MTDFNGFDKGVIGQKLPSDTTLNNMKKSELIKLLRLAESNHRVLAETYKIAVDTSKCNTCPLSLNGRKSYNQAVKDMQDNLIRNSRTEIIDGEITLIVTEDRVNVIAKEMLR